MSTPVPAQAATTTTPTPAATQTTGSGTTSQSSTNATTTTTTTAPPATREPIRLEYQALTVEQILNMFQQEIEKDAVVYLEEARRVAEYDAILRDSQRDLNMLTENVRRCLIEQKEVEQTLVAIGDFQSEIDRNLDTVERNIDELFGSQSHLVPVDADQERETAYKLAHDVDVRLQELNTVVQTTMQQMESAEERALSGDVAKIVQMLHQHQRSLANLEDVARRMDIDMAHINRVLTQR
jgi:nuclear pore complex protein Nup62